MVTGVSGNSTPMEADVLDLLFYVVIETIINTCSQLWNGHDLVKQKNNKKTTMAFTIT